MPVSNPFPTDELTSLIDETYPHDYDQANITLRSFRRFSYIFTACPCAAVACLALASARLGKVGAWSSGTLYLTYTLSSVMGATLVVKQLGAKNAMICGMSLYVVYVSCFWVAITFPQIEIPAALIGAALGGIGSGILWTAQGTYFTQAAEEHALCQGCEWADCTAALSGTFAFAYLLEETILHMSSYLFIEYLNIHWSTIFAVYALVAVSSTVGMFWVKDYPLTSMPSSTDESIDDTSQPPSTSQWNKILAALGLLWNDTKMKYLVGMNMVFGFSGAFLNSFVSGEVIRVALNDESSKTVGLFVSWTAFVAAIVSLIFGKYTHDYGKGPVMIFGNFMFLGVALPFILFPDLKSWTWYSLLLVYACQGIGRATFESTMKAVFADMFPYEKEGAFANIILQDGLSGSIGYLLTFQLVCSDLGPYCVEYRNGTLHDVLSFEILVCVTAVAAVVGYIRASQLYWKERTGTEANALKDYRVGSIRAYRQSRSSIVNDSS